MNCPHHPTCPGCPLLDLPYEAQLNAKRDRLVEAFSLYPQLPTVPAVRGSAWTEGYRHRLKLPLHVTGDHVSIGLYDRTGTQVTDTPDCPVLHPRLRETLTPLLAWMRGKRGIHSLDLRVSALTGQLQAVLAVAGGDLPGGVKKLVGTIPGLASVAVSRADREGKRVLGQDARTVAGTHWIEEGIGDTRYRLHPGAFFQIDPRQAAVLQHIVRTFAGDSQRILDLYSGVGAYGLALAPGRQQVVMVEELEQAANAAREVAPPNVQVIHGRVENTTFEHPFDLVILNPARRGADPGLLARLPALARRAIYVSCGPETLARDLDCLAAHGLRVAEIQPIDLFPQTAEVETVVLLGRGPQHREWKVAGGKAQGPWHGEPSGALGRATRLLVLAVGDTGPTGTLPGARYRRLGVVATHSLLRIDLEGSPIPALAGLAKRGHPIAGRDPRTRRFFADKAGLVRPFVHIEEAGKARAPLHGDLVQVLLALGADDQVLARAGL